MKLALGLLLLSSVAFGKDCMAPWGATVKNGKSVRAWNFSVAPRGFTCQSQVRECRNGELLGVYSHPDCIESPPIK